MSKITPTVGLACAGALVLSLVGTAAAQAQSKTDREAKPQRVVMECARDDATRRAFTREFGAEPVFVTASEVRAANASDERWTAPRCMTAREHARLVEAMTPPPPVQMASVR